MNDSWQFKLNIAPNKDRERKLNPYKDADEILRRGEWQQYADLKINNGKWKSYYHNGKLVAYTFREAATIEVHQQLVSKKLLGDLFEKFQPLPPLNEDQKKENERLYWERIRRVIKENGWDR